MLSILGAVLPDAMRNELLRTGSITSAIHWSSGIQRAFAFSNPPPSSQIDA